LHYETPNRAPLTSQPASRQPDMPANVQAVEAVEAVDAVEADFATHM
jgi:hypothetical protein